ncbi:MAG: hypothetical protein KIT36_00615 [Alphaproteobacteria bacterium]|nr:hypothetical protein [Alphaproteobacteria bacterium]
MAGPLGRAAGAMTVAAIAVIATVAASRAAELVMYHSKGCAWCAAWDRQVGTVYDKTAEARVLPLRRVDADHDGNGGVRLAKPVEYTPTFVIVSCGRELGRITGYPGEDHFWGLLDAEIERHRSALAATC